ncbi:MAG: NADP-dependent phosphogluconate dehydrogenase [Planctomycetes bacterium]|nr:NADP-dependent phosphogluconate dehydrogenase [Planctomycetota bacterium]
MANPQSSIGLVGLAVMGENLALNIASRGFPITVFNRSTDKVSAFLKQRVRPGDPVRGAMSPQEFAASLARPRRILLMVKAGQPVDDTIASLLPHLERGDLIVDGGNSHPRDTERRSRELAAKGFRFFGMGVSGGEEGALKGPSLMPGGPREGYEELKPILTRIAAQVDDGPCVTYIGPGSAGHFVKMVHNGIEYGDMQLIAEAYDVMGTVLGMGAEAMAPVFAAWNRGPLESFLIEITATVLTKHDPETGKPMVDVILDRAGQKGTGRWTSEIALELGVSLPTIHAAVEARMLSAQRDQRVHASTRLRGPQVRTLADRQVLQDLHDALYCAKICSYAQGMDLLRVAGEANQWQLELAEIARIWKGGCIIRARFLDRIKDAFRREPRLANLLLDEELGGFLVAAQERWRRIVALGAAHGVPLLAMGASLAYFDSYRRARLPQNLTQAQRDFFGAHTFERVDRPAGQPFHVEWNELR